MAEIKVKLGNTANEVLNMLSTEEGFGLSSLADEIELSESAVSKQVTKLRGLGLVERHRDQDGDLLIYLSAKGENFLSKNTELNPKSGGDSMAVSVKISDDLVEELDTLMEEEELSSYAEAVDFALADYFELVEDEDEVEVKENRG